MSALTPFFRRVAHLQLLGVEEQTALERASSDIRQFAPRRDIMQEGGEPDGVKIVLSGLAYQYKTLPDGRRQIVGYFVPGDVIDLRTHLLRRLDRSVATFAATRAAVLSQERVQELMLRYPATTRALWWCSLVDASVAREWIVNVGYRTAFERMAHFFCEMFARLQGVGLTGSQQLELPVTQIELADTLALSPVHVNRTLMEMRRAKLVSFQGGTLTLHNLEELQSLAGFDPNYLHLDRPADWQDARRA